MDIQPLRIYLTNGGYTLVDESDYLRYKNTKWLENAQGYAVTWKWDKALKRNKFIRLHRIIVSASRGKFVDHINGNKLDNRRSNLRFCTISQNNQNQKRRKDNTSGYKGVGMHNGRWRARVRVGGKQISLGYFDTPELAYKAYIRGTKIYFGEFAYGN